MKPLPLSRRIVEAGASETLEYKMTEILYETVNSVWEADEILQGPHIKSHISVAKAIEIAQKWLTKRDGRFKVRELKT